MRASQYGARYTVLKLLMPIDSNSVNFSPNTRGMLFRYHYVATIEYSKSHHHAENWYFRRLNVQCDLTV